MECCVLQYTVGARLAVGIEHSAQCFAGARAIVWKDYNSSVIRIRRNGTAHGRRPGSGGGVLRGLVGRFVSGPGLLNACKCCLDVSSDVQM